MNLTLTLALASVGYTLYLLAEFCHDKTVLGMLARYLHRAALVLLALAYGAMAYWD